MYNNQGGYGAPPAFPSPTGYSPGYGAPPGPPPSGYGPPPGPPPSGYGAPSPFPGSSLSYGPPSGPPPPIARGSYPGQQYRQQHQPPPQQQHHHQGGYPGQFAPPSGPPPFGQSPSFAPPPGPPPMPPMNQQNYGPQFQGPNHQMQQPYFQYSQCNGKKKALCIGINYLGTSAALRGCVNDVKNIRNFLCSQYGYRLEDIVVLTDQDPDLEPGSDPNNPRNRRHPQSPQWPSKANIQRAMQWLVQGASPNDSLFFHYSGHGGQTKDMDGDEADGHDEVIYPVNFKERDGGHITDDEMHAIMVRPLPAGCRLTAIFDSCHSGSALDLPYIYSTEGKVKEPNLAAEAGMGLKTAFTSYARGDMGGVLKSAMGLVKTATGSGQKAEEYSRQTRTSPADVISWSGCKDSQTSADATEAGQATGAMSYAFIAALRQQSQQSYQQLLISLREILRNKYSQKPQLSSSHPMDTNIMFIC